MPVIDERIKEWATERQAEYIDAVNLYGSNQKAAVALGVKRQIRAHNETVARVCR